MKNLVKKIEYKGQFIEVYQDENADTPNEWGNTDAFLVYEHRSFQVDRKGFKPREIFEHTCKTKRMTFNGYHVFVVYAYIHSEVSLSLCNDTYPFNDKWDVSTTGYVLVKRQKGTYTRKDAIPVAMGEIEDWNNYLSGNIYGYKTETDSCWGYYGDYNTSGLLEDAKSAIDFNIQQKAEKYGKQLNLEFI